MASFSAGLLVYRLARGPGTAPAVEVLLVHPGGPFWARKDEHAWSVPKGEHLPDEDPATAARREFREELGSDAPQGPMVDLGQVTQSGGKRVRAWAVAGDLDVETIESNTFEMEWPPRSGTRRAFPEVDRAGWFSPTVARAKLVAAQAEFVDRLLAHLVAQGVVPGEQA